MFSKVEAYAVPISRISLYGEDTKRERDEVTKIEFPVNADYFLNLEYIGKDYGPHGYQYWGMLHVLSLGILPIAASNDIYLKATLYDRAGKFLQEDLINNESTLWAWLPLFFFNGNKLFPKMNEVVIPVQKSIVENAVSGLRI